MLRIDEYTLRPIEERDLAMVLGWRNSDRIRACMYTDHMISPDEHRAWFEALQLPDAACTLVFEIGSRPVGVVNASRIDRINGTCHWGFYLGEGDLPRGSGMALGFLGLQYLFGTLGMREVVGEAFASNCASVRFHEKLGFRRVGLLAAKTLKNGCYEDVVVFTLCSADWALGSKELKAVCLSQESDR
jgi:UDP-4-amino-4,6-dideoxy-N-acetyl-beta-L-altrosamine N-acetyltransferase